MTTAKIGTMTRMTLPQPSHDVVFCIVDDGAVLLSTRDEVYFGLNEVGATVWQLLSPATRSFEEICDLVATDYPEVDVELVQNDIAALLMQLMEYGLVQNHNGNGTQAGGT